MSPSGVGEMLKPFVFLDLFHADVSTFKDLPLHPHSGIGTVTVVTEGELRFDDPGSGSGVVGYGGVEWMRAGGGVWHGKEMSPVGSQAVRGFQLWIALPPELEDGPSEGQFFEARNIPSVGPARVIIGEYAGLKSPANAPAGITYLLVTLAPGAHWTFQPPEGQDVAFVSVARGSLNAAEQISEGELAVFERGRDAIELNAGSGGATFVLGSAVPHPHDLVLGHYSVHSSVEALRAGETRIAALRPR